MKNSWRTALHRATLAMLCFAAAAAVGAEPQSGSGDTPSSANFMSSIKQAFKQDFNREVVRGHFDVGTPPDAHRYYCLIDTKTGKSEGNGVTGEPFVRSDGMTGIKGGAVGFYTCGDADKQGQLITEGYHLTPAVTALASKAAAPPQAPTPPLAVTASTPVTPAAGTAAGAGESPQSQIMAVFSQFVAGENAHDRAAVSELLVNSKDLVWTRYGGDAVWGHREVMDALEQDWKGGWTLDPQLAEAHVANVAPGVAELVIPLNFSRGGSATALPVRWNGVFVKTASGWRIASIFVTPLKSPQPG